MNAMCLLYYLAATISLSEVEASHASLAGSERREELLEAEVAGERPGELSFHNGVLARGDDAILMSLTPSKEGEAPGICWFRRNGERQAAIPETSSC